VVAEEVWLAALEHVVLVALEHSLRPVGPAGVQAVAVPDHVRLLRFDELDARRHLLVEARGRLNHLEVALQEQEVRLRRVAREENHAARDAVVIRVAHHLDLAGVLARVLLRDSVHLRPPLVDVDEEL
jgi:hypothetical protein